MQFYDLTKISPNKVEVNYGFGYKPMTLTTHSATLNGTKVIFIANDGKLGVDVSSKKPLSFIKFTWNLPGYSDNGYIYGDAFERSYYSLYWEKLRKDRRCMWYMAISDKVHTNTYGVMTGCNSFCYWMPNSGSLTLEIDIRNGVHPVHLGDRTLHATDIVCTQNLPGESVFKTMQRFCKIMCPNPRLNDKPVYGSNSWYYAFRFVTQQDMVNDANLLAECTEGFENRPYCVLDDGWEEIARDQYRFSNKIPWTADNKTKFPDLDALVEYIKSKDLIPGIWVRPLMGSRGTPKNMLLSHCKLNDNVIAYDPSIPETIQYVKDLITSLKNRGFKLIKHDFSTRDIMGLYHREFLYKTMQLPFRRFKDNTRTTAEIILDFYRAIRDAAGDDVIIIGCNTISHLSAGLFELQRIGQDTSPKHWNMVTHNGVNTLAFRMCQHNTFYAIDADCIGYTNDIPWKKDREWLNLLAISGTPLFTSVKPSLVTPEIKEELKKAYTLASKQSELALPQDWFETKIPTRWRTEETNQDFTFDWSYNDKK